MRLGVITKGVLRGLGEGTGYSNMPKDEQPLSANFVILATMSR